MGGSLPRRRPDACVELGSRRQDTQEVYFVQDNGVGLDMRYADKLTCFFVSITNSKRAGHDFMGNGLSTTQGHQRLEKPCKSMASDFWMLPKDHHAGRRVRANEFTRLLPIVILTSSNEEQDLINGYGLGANSYVRKPIDFGRFMDAVRHLGLYWLILNEPAPQ